ncbi:DUF5995 family protein [Frankia sp. CiP1_Cm_nod1]
MSRLRTAIIISLTAGLSIIAIPARATVPTGQAVTPATYAWARQAETAFPPPCATGSATCTDAVITTMRNRLRPLEDHCDPRALFALVYLRTTEAFRDAAATPGYFADPAWVRAEAALFAEYYFRAFDGWADGRPAGVPPVWRTAFATASTPTPGDPAGSPAGGLVLSMHAHITRDLPFVLAAMGLTGPDGSSHKGDHDRINEILAKVAVSLLTQPGSPLGSLPDEIADRLGTDREALVPTLVAARENAWRDAERLVAARDGRERTVIAWTIEARAEAGAQGLRPLFTDVPVPASTTSCATSRPACSPAGG